MLLRMATIVFIFLCTTGAWVILGNTVMIRTTSHDANLKNAVGQLWGTSQRQLAPQLYYQTIEQATINTIAGNGLVSEAKNQTINHPLLLDSSDIRTQLNLEHRQK